MFLAHMPAGYIVSKALLSQFREERSKAKWLMCLGLLGSVFPDLDMFYFYLIDKQQHQHHSYWTHIPFYWIALLGISYLAAAIYKSRTIVVTSTIFITCVLLHLALDSFAGGGIKWFHPFDHTYLRIFSIPAQNRYWIWNYLLHWTALIEFLIILIASLTFWKTQSFKRRHI